MSSLPSSAVGANISSVAPNAPSEPGAKPSGTRAVYASSSNPSSHCPQGLCAVENNDGSAELLESHHSNFLAHKALWEKQRQGLMANITNLEERIRQYTFPKGSDIAMPDVYKIALARHGLSPLAIETSCLGETAGNQAGRETNAQSNTVAAVYTGPESIARPLPSTTESVAPKTGKSFEEMYQEAKPSYQFSNSLGNLKHHDDARSKTTASSIRSRSPQSSRSTAPSSFAQESPSAPVQEPAWTLQLPLVSKENMIKHAGHTPMARTQFGLDGPLSAIGSDLPTPIKEPGKNAVPLEPQPSTRPPSERSDSYFPLGSVDDDPELQQPLALKNEDSGNEDFMSELQWKLEDAATKSTPPAAASTAFCSDEKFASADEMGFEQLEIGPPLRFRRSLNFGTQLGGIAKPEN
ncbi:MAG: hypothetical protein Q9169_006497 [Polycauliona sp. 2 TL-2023]